MTDEISLSTQAPEPAKPLWRVLMRALLWWMAVFAALIFGVFVGGFVTAFYKAFFRTTLSGPSQGAVVALCTMVSAQMAMLLISRFEARRLRESRWWGLVNGPIKRPKLLLALCIGMMVYAGILATAFVDNSAGRQGGFASYSVVQSVLLVTVIGLTAPLTEEMFCRGMLWAMVEPRIGRIGAAVFTALLFLLMHFDRGLIMMALLIPLAVAVSLARGLCGSVRASFLVHMLNNLAGLGLSVLASV